MRMVNLFLLKILEIFLKVLIDGASPPPLIDPENNSVSDLTDFRKNLTWSILILY